MERIHKPKKNMATDDSGSGAVEFALVAPALILMIFGVFAACAATATVNGLEQLSAGAARSSVPGLSDAERAALAAAYVSANQPSYPYVDAKSLKLTTASDAGAKTFTVTLTYDLSGNAVLAVARTLAPAMPTTVTRKSVVITGGT